MILFENFYQQFRDADSDTQKEDLAAIVKSQGYGFINEWIIQLEKEIKWVEEKDLPQVQELLEKAAAVLPKPEQHSPLWKGIWSQLTTLAQNKKLVFGKVEEAERFGEWQVILENPASNEGITVHARLSLPEAAYLFAKFYMDLAKKEYISLQRVQTFIAQNGHLGPSL